MIQSISYFFGALLGLAGGSFLGVVVARQKLADSHLDGSAFGRSDRILFGRSRCDQCHHQLSWYENIPLISFILLKGRCRKCHSPIPYWLPLIEIAGAAAGVVVAAQGAATLPSILIAAALIWIFFSDLVYGLIPDWAVAVGSLGALLQKDEILLVGRISSFHWIWPAAAAGFFFWFLVKITRGRGMGTGDITLAFFLGLWLGWPLIAIGLWLAFIIGAIFGIILIILKKKKLKSALPFGPFMILGSLLAIQWGQMLLDKFF